MQRRVSSAAAAESKTEAAAAKGPESADNTDSDSVEEMPLDIGNHYLVRRADKKWHPAEIIQVRTQARRKRPFGRYIICVSRKRA
jgi:hypothetical protein